MHHLLNTINKPGRLAFIRSNGLVLAIQVSSAGFLFLINLLLARSLGTAGLGAYDYAESWVELLLTFALAGFDRLLISQMAAFQAASEWALLRGIWQLANRVTRILSLGLALVIGVLIPSLVQDKTDLLRPTLTLAMGLLIIRVFIRTQQAALQAFRKAPSGLAPDYFIRPGLFLMFIGLVYFGSSGELTPPLAMLLHLVAGGVALGFSGYFIHRQFPNPIQQISPVIKTHTWIGMALPFAFISGMTLFNLRGIAIVLEALTNLHTVGLYGISVRLSTMISIVLTSSNAVLAAYISRYYTLKKIDRLQQLLTISGTVVSIITLPIGIGIIVFGRPLLQLFGPDFVAAYPALVILCIGQMISVLSGPVNWLLMMTQNERALAVVLTLSTALSIILCLILIPSLELIGVAIAVSATMALRNIVLVGYIRWKLGIWSTPIYLSQLWKAAQKWQ